MQRVYTIFFVEREPKKQDRDKLTSEMRAKIPMIWEKRENDFHFYFVPSLPLPPGERERVRGHEVKCSQYSIACLISGKIQRIL